MTFSKDSLILIDYVAKVKGTDKIFDTTIKEQAEEHLIYDPNNSYLPQLVSIGNTTYPVLQGLDEALAETSVGDKLTVEVTPDKGFGERDHNKIRMIPIRKLGEDADKISIGDTIDIDNRRGIVRFMGSGRVQVDFNHKYAGKTIVYDVSVVRYLETDHDKINSILQNRFRERSVRCAKTDQKLNIWTPTNQLMDKNAYYAKNLVVHEIIEFVPTLEEINFIDAHIFKDGKETTYEVLAETQTDDSTEPTDSTETQTDEPGPPGLKPA